MYGDLPRLPRHYILLLYITQKATLNSAWIERDQSSRKPKKGNGNLKVSRLPALSNTVVSKRTVCFDMQNLITFTTKCRVDFRINFWIDSNYSPQQKWRINNLMGVQCVYCDVDTKGKYRFWDPQVSVVKTVATDRYKWKMNSDVAMENCKATIKKLNAVVINKGWLFHYMNSLWL